MKSTILLNFFNSHNGIKTHFADGSKTLHGNVNLITDDDIIEYEEVIGPYENVTRACLLRYQHCGWMNRSIFGANDDTYIIVITKTSYGSESRL